MTRIFLVGDSPELAAAVLRQGGLRLSGQVPNLTFLLPLVRDCPADVLLITREGLDDWPPEQALPRLRALNPQLRLAVVLQPGEGAAGADWSFGPQTTPGQMLRAILAGPEPPGGPDSPLAGATGRPPEGLLRLFARSPAGETAGNSTAPIVDAGPPSRPAPAVVAFCGPKGGVGKTTLAANLAAALARDGARSVLLVDLSLRSADVGVHLDLL
ncbi:MAG: AAA family ATPase, partial [Firmicutes bacterium]|nr:AAA family ATPase [Bacillota bacterium]